MHTWCLPVLLVAKAVPLPHIQYFVLQEKLPSAIPDGEPLPEGLLWLLLTGDVSGAEPCCLCLLIKLPCCSLPTQTHGPCCSYLHVLNNMLPAVLDLSI